MEQNTVKLTAKEVVKDQIASTLRHIDRRIAVISEKMNADYLHFFEWQAEEMFKVQKTTRFLYRIHKGGEKLGRGCRSNRVAVCNRQPKERRACKRKPHTEQHQPNGKSRTSAQS